MDKLTIEEKAKRYDELSKEVKDFFDGKQKMYSDVGQTLSYLFPEFRDSEDERIRKSIISGMKALQKKGKYTRFANIPVNNVIAWLEKQGKQKPAEWSEEDKEMIEGLNNCLDELEEDNGWYYVYVNNKNIKLYKIRNWLKSLRPQNHITDEKLAQPKKDAYNDALDKIEYHSGNPTFDDG